MSAVGTASEARLHPITARTVHVLPLHGQKRHTATASAAATSGGTSATSGPRRRSRCR